MVKASTGCGYGNRLAMPVSFCLVWSLIVSFTAGSYVRSSHSSLTSSMTTARTTSQSTISMSTKPQPQQKQQPLQISTALATTNSSSSFLWPLQIQRPYQYVTEEVDCVNLSSMECDELEHFYMVKAQQAEFDRTYLDENGNYLGLSKVDFNNNKNSSSSSRRDLMREHRRRLVSPPTGDSIRVFLLLVQFPDHADRTLPDPSYFQDLCDGSAPSATNPVGSLKDYFNIQSHGQYKFTCEVSGWHLTDNTEAYYSLGCSNSCTNHVDAQKMAHAAMDKAETEMIAKYGDKWWYQFDSDKDFNFDMFLIIHSGYNSIAVNRPICDGTTEDMRIRPQGHSYSSSGWQSSGGQYITVRSYAISSAFEDGDCATPNAEIGIIAHEMCHLFGAIDLYDDTTIMSTGFIGGIGDFGLMASLRGPGKTSGDAPGSVSAYTKELIGWADVVVIGEDGSFDIEDVAISDQVYRIDHGYKTGEYLLIENRQKKNFDKNMYASGIVIYHVDENKDGNVAGSAAPGDSDWPSNHYRVAVVQKDGLFELEKGLNSGDANDFFTYYDSLTPSGGNIKIQPNSDSYYNGPTGVSIRIETQSQPIMTFFVSGISSPSLPFPSPATTPAPTIAPTDKPTPVPTTSQPTTSQPTTSQPTTSQPTTSQPTTSQPTTSQPTTSQPTASQPTTLAPVTSQPTPAVASPGTPSTLPTTNAPSVPNITSNPAVIVASPSTSPAPSISDRPSVAPVAPGAGIPTAAAPPSSGTNEPTSSQSSTIASISNQAPGSSSSSSSSSSGSKKNGGASPAWLVSYFLFAGFFVGAYYAARHLLRRLKDIDEMEPALGKSSSSRPFSNNLNKDFVEGENENLVLDGNDEGNNKNNNAVLNSAVPAALVPPNQMSDVEENTTAATSSEEVDLLVDLSDLTEGQNSSIFDDEINNNNNVPTESNDQTPSDVLPSSRPAEDAQLLDGLDIPAGAIQSDLRPSFSISEAGSTISANEVFHDDL
ncbi:hypothetical protein ACA910_002022 [Epithemia clementina (nom. ined.)]